MTTEPEHTPTRPTRETRAFEQRDAQTPAKSDRPPTEAEAAVAPEDVDPQVEEAYREALERGAAQKGEGRIV
ncbi:MAG: hypothetical protein AB7V43_21790 [Acidimicrobiia bacterium]